jgi:hypothetical protein
VLYAGPEGNMQIAEVARLNRFNQDIYLERLSSTATRVQVRVVGPIALDGETGWIDKDAIESAGEKCMGVYSLN